MNETTIDQLIADTLVEDYGREEKQAYEAVAAWRAQGSPNDDGDAVQIAERIYQATSDED